MALGALTGCSNPATPHSDEKMLMNKLDTSIIADFYEDGQLVKTKYFSLDSIQYGPEMEYKNASIHKWKWFEKNDKYPMVIVKFDSAGEYESFRGTPFLKAVTTPNNKTAVQMVHIPGVRYDFAYRDFLGSKLVREERYEPDTLNGTAWVTLDDHKFETGHEYFVYFYFYKGKIGQKDSAYTELVK
jgi:hypothetical protein